MWHGAIKKLNLDPSLPSVSDQPDEEKHKMICTRSLGNVLGGARAFFRCEVRANDGGHDGDHAAIPTRLGCLVQSVATAGN